MCRCGADHDDALPMIDLVSLETSGGGADEFVELRSALGLISGGRDAEPPSTQALSGR